MVYLDEVALKDVAEQPDEVVLNGQRGGDPLAIRARFVVDATGPRGFLHRALSLQEAPFENFPATQALYTHFTGVRRMGVMLALLSLNRSAPSPLPSLPRIG